MMGKPVWTVLRKWTSDKEEEEKQKIYRSITRNSLIQAEFHLRAMSQHIVFPTAKQLQFTVNKNIFQH